jgi:hypothetical protein
LAELAEHLVDRARGSTVELTGPGGLLSGVTKQVLETPLRVEMTDHLRYERNDPAGGRGNSRNGATTKTVRTDTGDVEVSVPRDWAGSFTPAVIPKHDTRARVEQSAGVRHQLFERDVLHAGHPCALITGPPSGFCAAPCTAVGAPPRVRRGRSGQP